MTLGVGSYAATLTGRGGGPTFGTFDELGTVKWARTQDSPSLAEITLPVDDCCELLGRARAWGHELHLHRDGEEVWAGPLIRPAIGKATATLTARDVSAWLGRRVVRDPFIVGRRDGVGLALLAVRAAFADDDPGVLPYVQTVDGAAGATANHPAHSAYYSDVLDEIARTVIDWTVIGRSIVLMPDGHDLGHVARLSARDFRADLTVVEDGEQGVVRAYAAADGVKTGQAGLDPDPFYGLLETLIRVDGKPDHDDLVRIARNARAAGYPIPVTIEVPSGAALSPDAPVSIAELVPGVTMTVAVGGCRPLTRILRLIAVDVTAGPGTEQVSVTLGQPV